MTDRASGYLRGAFIAWDPGGYPSDPSKKKTIAFWFNPEGLQRKLTVEQGQAATGTEGAAKSSSGSQQASDASTGTVKESFSVLLRFDARDRPQSFSDGGDDLGVLPEIAALEDLLQPAESDTTAPSDGTEAAPARSPRPTVLFVWGRKRLLPVKITGLDINETLHNSALNPVRAEVQVALEVLTDAHAKDNLAVGDALGFTLQNRRSLARMYHEQAAASGTRTGDA